VRFFPNLNQKDWVALVTFDMRPRTEVGLHGKTNRKWKGDLSLVITRDFSESNLFDALLDTNERLKDVKGKKSILVLASGVDTFSKHTLDQTMKQLRGTDTTIFCGGAGQAAKQLPGNAPVPGTMTRMDFLQAENQMKTFAQMTGDSRGSRNLMGASRHYAGSGGVFEASVQHFVYAFEHESGWKVSGRSKWSWWRRTAGRWW